MTDPAPTPPTIRVRTWIENNGGGELRCESCDPRGFSSLGQWVFGEAAVATDEAFCEVCGEPMEAVPAVTADETAPDQIPAYRQFILQLEAEIERVLRQRDELLVALETCRELLWGEQERDGKPLAGEDSDLAALNAADAAIERCER